jgi:hypothetical protein
LNAVEWTWLKKGVVHGKLVFFLVLYLVQLSQKMVSLARGNEIPHYWWMCKIVEANATNFTLPKIWVKHEVLRCVYWWLEGPNDIILCHLCGVFTINGNPTRHAHGNQWTLTLRLKNKPLACQLIVPCLISLMITNVVLLKVG